MSKVPPASETAGGSGDFQRIVSLVGAGVIVASTWAAIGLLIWNLDRGFDLTDEAHLLYLYRHPDTFSPRLYWQYQSLINALVPSYLDHVLFYRLIKFLALLGAAAAFAAVLARWIKYRCSFLSGYGLSPIAFIHFLVLASLFAFCHGAQTLSYNDVVTVLVLVGVSALIVADVAFAARRSLASVFALSFLAGALLVPLVFTKYPTAILVSLYYLAFFAAFGAQHGWRFVLSGVAGVFGGAFSLALVFTDLGTGTLFSFDKLFRAASDPVNTQDHGGVTQLLSFYLQTSIQKLSDVIRSPAVAALMTLPIITMVVRSQMAASPTRRVITRVFAVAILFCFVAAAAEMAFAAAHNTSWLHRSKLADLHSFLAVFALIGAIVVIPAAAREAGRKNVVVAVVASAVLGSLAIACAVGTNNPLLTQFIRHMAFIFAALALLTALLGLAGKQPAFAPSVCAVVAILMTAQLYVTVLLYPYRLARPASDQSVALEKPVFLKGLKVDPATYAFIDKLVSDARLALGDTRNLPMLSMFDIPGVVYLLDGVSVGSPWLLAGPHMVETSCRQVAADPLSREKLGLIALDRDVLPAEIVACLRGRGIDLSSYRELTPIDLPSENGTRRTLHLLIPREPQR
jgi:hypothetical protein